MANIQIEAEPAEVGLDAERLARIDRHFQRYVDDGRFAGWSLAIARHGKVAHLATAGRRDEENDLPVELDTVWRIFSMTKPVTAVAALMLMEEGAFALNDPVHRYLPEFRETRVYSGGSALNPQTEPLVRPLRVWHLFTHTSGLTYGFQHAHPVDAMYRNAGYEWSTPNGTDLAKACEAWAGLPLLFQPGTEWNYGVSTDVLGRLVEVVSGQPLDEFFAERIFAPLGMVDTAFWARDSMVDRLAALYVALPGGDGSRFRFDGFGMSATESPTFLSGGAGLLSTLGDYHRFAQMLRNRGELDGVRLLGPRTVDYMASNHLPNNADLESFGRPLFSETTFDGIGFGLGVSVTVDPVKNKIGGSAGEYGWGGAASTIYWVDPVEDTTVVFMTQLLPSTTHPNRSELKQILHQAFVD